MPGVPGSAPLKLLPPAMLLTLSERPRRDDREGERERVRPPPPGPRLLLREGGPLPLPSPFAWALAAKESPARLLPRPRRLPER